MEATILKKFYLDQVVPELKKKYGYSNPHQVPVIQKTVINSGVSASMDKNVINDVAKDIASITGQKPILTKAKRSVSNFKLRAGMPIGVKVTLRGGIMWDFLYRLIAIALPTIRDFRGVPTKFDGHGNYNLGITDHTIFPEIHPEHVKQNLGMDITIVTTAISDEEGRELLRLLGMPFRKPQGQAAAATPEGSPSAETTAATATATA